MKIDFKKLALCLAIPLGLGALTGFLTSGSMDAFGALTKPPLSPPGILFPIVWSILYALMGFASYLVLQSNCQIRNSALGIYALQLIFNIAWSFIFFTFEMYLFAFIWLLVLLLLVMITAVLFYSCKRLAGYLFVPYILWLLFAGYLNLGIYILN